MPRLELESTYSAEEDRDAGGNTSLKIGVYHMRRGDETGDVTDYELAREWFERGIALGNTDAMVALGVMYYLGRLGRKDYEKTVALYSKAAENGHAEACNMLGDIYASGSVCQKDDNKAFSLYQKAYELGNHGKDGVTGSAAYRLGSCYEMGHGCREDLKKALSYYREAVKELSDTSEEMSSQRQKDLRGARQGAERLSR